MSPLVEGLKSRKGLLALKEVAAILGCHTMTARKWAKSGKIGFVRVGRQIKFDPAVVAAWLEAREG